MKCKNHPDLEAVARCVGCNEAFCQNCLVEVGGNMYCGACKIMAVQGTPSFVDESVMVPCEEAKEALKYSLIGIFCFGFILEPIAISKALKAKKRIKEEGNLTGEGKANAALIIGIVFTILWVIGMIQRLSTL